MAASWRVSNDQDISIRLLCRRIQGLRNIAAIDDDVEFCAYLLLDLGDLFGREANQSLLPHWVDVRTSGAIELNTGRDVDQSKRCIHRRGPLGGQRHGVPAVT